MDFPEPPVFLSTTSNQLNLSCSFKRRKDSEAPATFPAAAPPLQPLSSSLFLSSILSDIAPQIKQQRDQIDRLLRDHGDRLRRAVAETQRRHYLALLGAAEGEAARRLSEKEDELDRAARRAAELEERLARLKSELMTWQSKALADQSTATALHARLQQVSAPKEEPIGTPAVDAESAHVDPVRFERTGSGRPCRVCGLRPASIVLLPCRHLCLCDRCDVAAGCDGACPVCRCVSTGCVQVFLS